MSSPNWDDFSSQKNQVLLLCHRVSGNNSRNAHLSWESFLFVFNKLLPWPPRNPCQSRSSPDEKSHLWINVTAETGWFSPNVRATLLCSKHACVPYLPPLQQRLTCCEFRQCLWKVVATRWQWESFTFSKRMRWGFPWLVSQLSIFDQPLFSVYSVIKFLNQRNSAWESVHTHTHTHTHTPGSRV